MSSMDIKRSRRQRTVKSRQEGKGGLLQIWVLDVSSYGLHINVQLKIFSIIHVHWKILKAIEQYEEENEISS